MTQPETRAASLPRTRLPIIVAGVTATATLVLLPFSAHQLGPTTSFVPAMLSAVACFDVLSVFFLVGDYLDRGDARLLVMGWAYLWSLLEMVAYALAFPGGVSASPPLATGVSVAPYLYVLWHGGFPLLLGIAWAPWPMRFREQTLPHRRTPVAVMGSLVTSVVALGLVALIVLDINHLPLLIVGRDLQRMQIVTGPIVLPLAVLGVALTWRGLRSRTGPERWAFVAAAVCLCDLLLTYASRFRYSLGWYVGRSLTVVSAAVVLVAMLGAFRRLKSDAEFFAAYDVLTGLANRRSGAQAVQQAFARAKRSNAPLSVLMVDLDRFKQINDTLGHKAGDRVLEAVRQCAPRGGPQGGLLRALGRGGVSRAAPGRGGGRGRAGCAQAARAHLWVDDRRRAAGDLCQPRSRVTYPLRHRPRDPAPAGGPGDVRREALRPQRSPRCRQPPPGCGRRLG